MCNLYSFGSPNRVMEAANAAIGRKVKLGPNAGNLPEGYVGADSDGPELRCRRRERYDRPCRIETFVATGHAGREGLTWREFALSNEDGSRAIRIHS